MIGSATSLESLPAAAAFERGGASGGLRLEASGLTPTTEITTSKRSEFLPHSPFLPLFITLSVVAVVAAARGDILVVGFIADILVNISIPGRREGFQITFPKYWGKERHVRRHFQFNVRTKKAQKILLFGASVKGCCRRQQHARLQCTTVHTQQGIWEHKTTTTSPLLLGRGGGGRGRHRSFSRLCYLSRRQFRNSGAVPQNRLCEIGLNPESEMSMLGSLDAQI